MSKRKGKGKDFALLGGRLVLGSYLAAHGAQKLFGSFDGYGIDATAAAFDGLGLRPGRAMATLASVSELAGGLLTATGIAYPLGPVAIAGTMAVASSTHRAKGPFAAKGGFELPLTNMAAALALAVNGPGRFSLGGPLPKALTRLVVLGAAVTSGVSLAMVLGNRPGPAASTDPGPSPAADEKDDGTEPSAGTGEDV
jgi:putative oxidoreductase